MIGLGINYKDTKTLTDSNMAIVEQLWAKQPGDEPVVFDNGHYKGAVVSSALDGQGNVSGVWVTGHALDGFEGFLDVPCFCLFRSNSA